MSYWKSLSFINRNTFCDGNTACIQVDGETFFALHGNLIAKMDKNDHVYIKHNGNPNISTRNRIADIIRALHYPFTVRFKHPDNTNGARIILTYKYPKDNMPPVKERRTHEINGLWTDLYELKVDIEKNIQTDTTNRNQLTNALANSLSVSS